MPDVMSSIYIPCDVRPGLFSTEYTVTVRDLNGEVTSFFADRELVKRDSGHSCASIISE